MVKKKVTKSKPEPDPLIRNIKELADQWTYGGGGGDDPAAALERAVYKHTGCGASFGVQQCAVERIKPKKMSWIIRYKRKEPGSEELVLDRAIRLDNPARRGDPYLTRRAAIIPEPVRQYACLNLDGSAIESLTYTHFKENVDTIVDKEKEVLGCRVTADNVEIDLELLDTHRSMPGVVLSSIVEGVDETTSTYELVFPFKLSAFEKALENVEAEANEIWERTHGCEDCGPVDTDSGYIPINPECKSCGGEGGVF